MKYRVVFVSRDREDWLVQARFYLDGTVAKGIFEGEATSKTPPLASNENLLSSVREWSRGAKASWKMHPPKDRIRKLHLPLYPFDVQEYWFDQDPHGEYTGKPRMQAPKRSPAHHVGSMPFDEIAITSIQEKAERILRNALSPFLKISPDTLDLDAEFSELGFDSVLVTTLSSTLADEYALEVEPACFFEYTTPRQMTRCLCEKMSTNLKADTAHVTKKKKHILKRPICRIPSQQGESIAIIGLAGRFPQASNVEQLWANLAKGMDCIREVPEDRWSLTDYYHPDPNIAIEMGKSYGKYGGFLERLYEFDPLFFQISPHDAEHMNPKERLFLQCAWHTLEDAGYTPTRLFNEVVGVYAGVSKLGLDVYATTFSDVANRVSYVCDFHGPSLAIDTMCSSSLVAVHLACQHLISGECSVALAGGVNAYLHPSHFINFSRGRVLAADGKTKAFGEGANGLVPGEGVCTIMLKPLSRALVDQDHIYGVIRGSATNHGGKTNGYVIPNPKAHRGVIQLALQRSGINPRDISYVEAHGTGTALGDPIEIRGLTEAFREYTRDTEYCRIGSVKSNLGHLEAGAGITGLAKVLSQMKHGILVPSLHSNGLNPQINFSSTPFHVQQDLEGWNPVNTQGRSIPRTACISSFGAGGANAHVIIEEHVAQPQVTSDQCSVIREQSSSAASTRIGDSRYHESRNTDHQSYMIVLSAKNEDRLKEIVKNLLSWLTVDRELETVNLSEIAYTLQIGREPMKYRIAIVIDSRKKLLEELEGFNSKNSSADRWMGQANKRTPHVADFEVDVDAKSLLQTWIQKKNLKKMAALWVKGVDIDWNLFYGNSKPRKISLPTYPFAQELYRAPENEACGTTRPTIHSGTIIHPLLHQNTSDLKEQRFSSTFTGQEFFLANHQVRGQMVLPGVAFLEIARAAVEQAAGSLAEGQIGIQLRNVIWARPIVVNSNPKPVHIGLFSEENGQIRYEIYTESKDDKEDHIVHSQGVATCSTPENLPDLDLPDLRIHMNQGRLNSRQCYNTFMTMGFDYGSGHQGFESVFVGKNQVLAQLFLPSSLLETQDQYVLHPSLLNSALQASIGLKEIRNQKLEIRNFYSPFALETIEIVGKCTASMWAWIRYSDSSVPGNKVQKLDIDLSDETGNVCARMKGFSSRVFDGNVKPEETVGTLICHPIWKKKAIPKEADPQEYWQHLVILCEMGQSLTKANENHIGRVSYFRWQFEEKAVEKRFREISIQAFQVIKGILEKKTRGRVLIQILIPSQGKDQVFSGLSGLLKTAHLENPKILGQLIEADSSEGEEGLLRVIEENSRCPDETDIRYQDGKRYIARFEECSLEDDSITPVYQHSIFPFKQHGVYLITGGLGGLGMIFAKEIVKKTKNSMLILTGRSRLTREKQSQLKRLELMGARVDYHQVDVSQSDAVDDLIQGIENDFGKINGILHCAGVIRDSFILKKTVKEFQEVLAPKVAGTVYLDQATQDLDLDFFILFSSGASVLGNLGQADYACANAFMDAYVKSRNTLVAKKQRQGQTLSINWPLWKEGGMRVDNTTVRIMKESTGLVPMETSSGIQALVQGLSSKQSQLIVLEGDLPRIKQRFIEEKSKAELHPVKTSILPIDEKTLKEKTLYQLKRLFGEINKLSPDRIESHEPLESYGIDSIMITRLNQKLETIFGEISKTLFFEYLTLEALADYFIVENPEECMVWTGLESSALSRSQMPSAVEALDREFPLLNSVKPRNRGNGRFCLQNSNNRAQEPIAIIGISGRYSQADTLDEYWEVLKAGTDCITEIPQAHWSLEGFFHPDPQEAVAQGKSYSKWGSFLVSFADFDPLFFNISPREAMHMDPQERLFLQSSWQVLEDAGYTKESLMREYQQKVGVFAGITKTGFDLYGPELWKQGELLQPHTSFSSVANRISYVLNLQGPSMPIDTMCSSSLTAIHEACEHLRHQDCEMAIAGGVNLYLHPSTYIALCAMQMLSPDGTCKSFGKGGNGFVPGEGVGVVLLKRLSRAIQDHDHIYAVICGSSVNHGGKTNGYTVPNPKAQAQLIRVSLEKSGVNARTISYVEAHGTGTELGDPIEITGLTQAFQKDTSDRGFCALGSAKSNLGHLEAAAGIAGLSKVILQMKHRQLAPTLHARELNPNIEFENTPFIVQQQLEDWKRPTLTIDGETKEYSRVAGISSFGAGGSNAHVIIEEYLDGKPETRNSKLETDGICLIVLSAKNEDRLREIAKNLHAFLKNKIINHKFEIINLNDLAYTLQVGREAMEERLALMVRSTKELEERLKGFVEGLYGVEGLYRGQVKRHKEMLAVFTADEEFEKTIDKWIQQRKYTKLLDLWVKGLIFDWNKLYGDNKPGRISLPTYPFAKERYWIAEPTTPHHLSPITHHPSSKIHPLVHENTSNFEEQRFTSVFTGEEFFLVDHIFNQQRVLPEVAYLEMTLAAVDQAADILENAG